MSAGDEVLCCSHPAAHAQAHEHQVCSAHSKHLIEPPLPLCQSVLTCSWMYFFTHSVSLVCDTQWSLFCWHVDQHPPLTLYERHMVAPWSFFSGTELPISTFTLHPAGIKACTLVLTSPFHTKCSFLIGGGVISRVGIIVGVVICDIMVE